MKRRPIYIGDYVCFTEDYLNAWKSERFSRLEELRNTVFIVTDSCRCYSWRYGIGGGGMLLTLKPFFGPLAKEDIFLGRGESSVSLVEPDVLDDMIKRLNSNGTPGRNPSSL